MAVWQKTLWIGKWPCGSVIEMFVCLILGLKWFILESVLADKLFLSWLLMHFELIINELVDRLFCWWVPRSSPACALFTVEVWLWTGLARWVTACVPHMLQCRYVSILLFKKSPAHTMLWTWTWTWPFVVIVSYWLQTLRLEFLPWRVGTHSHAHKLFPTWCLPLWATVCAALTNAVGLLSSLCSGLSELKGTICNFKTIFNIYVYTFFSSHFPLSVTILLCWGVSLQKDTSPCLYFDSVPLFMLTFIPVRDVFVRQSS